jgi:hypothetical protein
MKVDAAGDSELGSLRGRPGDSGHSAAEPTTRNGEEICLRRQSSPLCHCRDGLARFEIRNSEKKYSMRSPGTWEQTFGSANSNQPEARPYHGSGLPIRLDHTMIWIYLSTRPGNHTMVRIHLIQPTRPDARHHRQRLVRARRGSPLRDGLGIMGCWRGVAPGWGGGGGHRP